MSSHESVCPNCNTRFPEAAAQCPACGASVTPSPFSAAIEAISASPPSGQMSGGVPGDEPDPARPDDLPPVYLSTRDYGRLESLASLHLSSDTPIARFLSAELQRAVVCQPNDIFADVVTLNSRVLFRTDTTRYADARVLVYPDRYFPTGQYLSILSPLGVALLGLREGSRMPFVDRQGSRCNVVVEKVAYQPEAPARHAP
jgi:regulator of nucleoside diphosphate kinase